VGRPKLEFPIVALKMINSHPLQRQSFGDFFGVSTIRSATNCRQPLNQLSEQAVTDRLTGLRNRAGIRRFCAAACLI